jgi:predicted nucleic acid-binding protein
VYLDSAYVAKYYLNEPDSARVRAAIAGADQLISSLWAFGEVVCAFHRHLRQGHLDSLQYQEMRRAFLQHVDRGVWTFIPVTEQLLRKMGLRLSALPPDTYIRTGDAVHLMTALESGEAEIWTSDCHVLAAAPHFGLAGRSV